MNLVGSIRVIETNRKVVNGGVVVEIQTEITLGKKILIKFYGFRNYN